MRTFDYSLLAKRVLALLCTLLLTAVVLIPLLGSSSNCNSPRSGWADLSTCTFNNTAVYPLRGEWEFYWQERLEPQVTLSRTAEAPAYMPVPGAWGRGVRGYRLLPLRICDLPSAGSAAAGSSRLRPQGEQYPQCQRGICKW